MAKYKAYPEYKDSGVEWLGEIPLNWSYIPHKYLAVYYKGRNPTTLSSEPKRDCVPYLSMSYLRTNIVEHYTLVTSDARVVPDDLVLIIWDGSNAGEFIKSKRGILSSTMAVANVTSKLNHQYYWFSCNCIEPEIRRHATGMGIPHVNGDHLRYIAMPRPSIEEQIKISLFLIHETMKIDLLVEKQQQLIELLKEKRQAVISHAVTKGLNPDVPMKDSGVDWLGLIPANWNIKKLGFIGIASNGLTYSPDEITSDSSGTLVLRSSNIQHSRLCLDDTVFVNKKIPSKFKLSENDILICSRNGSRKLIGKNILIGKNLEEMSYGAFMAVFRSKINKFIYWILNSSIFEYQSSSFLTSTINQLTIDNLSSMVVAIPPLDEQKKITQRLFDHDVRYSKILNKINYSIELLKERRTALIAAAVTGKIDLRDWTPPASSTEASLTAEEATA
ncbi:TPA: restriction endonuclease subunit S [Enterobacter asburiae]|nr:restriction endonuclease subunit S [Enterobacter asburiae]